MVILCHKKQELSPSEKVFSKKVKNPFKDGPTFGLGASLKTVDVFLMAGRTLVLKTFINIIKSLALFFQKIMFGSLNGSVFINNQASIVNQALDTHQVF